MLERGRAEFILAVVLVIFTSGPAALFILQYRVVASFLWMLALSLAAREMHMGAPVVKTAIRCVHCMSLGGVGFCFFIVANNVFLMRRGFSHCSGCRVSTVPLMCLAHTYLAIYGVSGVLFIQSFLREERRGNEKISGGEVPLGTIKTDL
jgi:hypothetical protein